jgi:hypothetical protein
MPPDRKNLYFYFDESLLGVGKAITIARRERDRGDAHRFGGAERSPAVHIA